MDNILVKECLNEKKDGIVGMDKCTHCVSNHIANYKNTEIRRYSHGTLMRKVCLQLEILEVGYLCAMYSWNPSLGKVNVISHDGGM